MKNEKIQLIRNSSIIGDFAKEIAFYSPAENKVTILAQCMFKSDSTLENIWRLQKYWPKQNEPCLCFSYDKDGLVCVRNGYITSEGFISAAGSTSYARGVMFMAEYIV